MDIQVIIVKVVLPVPIRKSFEYFIPDYMCPVIGGRVLVPFNSKDITGIVISFYRKRDISQLNFKYVKLLIDSESLYTNIVLDLIMWISKNYHCPIGNIFFSVLPKLLRSFHIFKNRYVCEWRIVKKGWEFDLNNFKKNKNKLHPLIFLKKNNILMAELKQYNSSSLVLKNLEIQELCTITLNNKIIFKKKYMRYNKRKFFLNQEIVFFLNKIFLNKCFSSWLLTKFSLYLKVKFYLNLISWVLYKDMQILIVVPYFKSTNIIAIFLKKYLNTSIDIIHSKLTDTQYLKNWIRTKRGENSIVIGTGESIFLPFLKLGVIIFFEEHNLKYKNIYQCRYNFRDLSILRAYKENIPIILDSETPSLQTLYNILKKKCFYIKLYKFYFIKRLNYNIIDLKKDKIKFGLSLTLIKEIQENFNKKQVLLIFNKLSLFYFVLKCNQCNQIFKCATCCNYFEINEHYNILYCRFCLIQIKKPIFCDNCGCFFLVILNLRIEKIKNKIQDIFPKKTLLFLLNKKKLNNNMLSIKNFKFSASSPHIIITTEEIVQEYYFPHVRLIALISIDNYFLNFNFRSIEYFAQFYFNLPSLIGNRKKPLKILIQTSFPKDVNLKDLCTNGYFSFAKKILSLRKKFLLPPWNFQSIIYSESVNAKNNIIFLNLIRKILEIRSNQYNCFLSFFGPHSCFFSKNKKKSLYQLLIQCPSRNSLHNILNESVDIINFFTIGQRVKWFIDMVPN